MNASLAFIGTSNTPQDWDALVAVPVVGRDVIISYPPSPGFNSQRFELFSLTSSDFWPNGDQAAPASDPTGNGSVKTALVVHPGLCSFELPFVTPGKTGVFDLLNSKLNQLIPTVSQEVIKKHSEVTSVDLSVRFLRLAPRFISPGRGFFLFTEVIGTGTAVPPFSRDIDLIGSIEYDIALTDGRITATPLPGDTLALPQLYGVPAAWDNALNVTARDSINTAASKLQRQTFAPCDSGNDKTVTARNIVRASIGNAGPLLGWAPGDVTTLQNVADDPNNWVCEVQADASNVRCPAGNCAQFILRAKRFEVYPDALELVWFDQADITDPMYALYVATVDLGQQTTFCGRQQVFLKGGLRSFAVRSLGTLAIGN